MRLPARVWIPTLETNKKDTEVAGVGIHSIHFQANTKKGHYTGN
jgi:hypothetical protein